MQSHMENVKAPSRKASVGNQTHNRLTARRPCQLLSPFIKLHLKKEIPLSLMEWYMEAVRRQNIEHRPSRHWRDKLQVSEVRAEMTHCCKNDWEILCVDWL